MPGFSVVAGDVLLVDQDGNPILSVADTGDYRLAVEASIKPGSAIGVIPGANPVTRGYAPLLKTGGGSEDMVVDGSTTPVVFSVGADPDDDLVLQELRLIMVADSIEWLNFGKGAGVLSNGLLIEAQLDGAASPTELFNLTRNEGFFRMQSPVKDSTSGDAIVGASLGFAGEMITHGSGDFVRITVRDDLTSALRKIYYFTATLYTRRQTPA